MEINPGYPKLVFVYGTLMRGFGNNVLLEKEEFLSEVTTVAEFHMLSLGAFPGVKVKDIISPAMAGRVKGELYRVYDEKTWEKLLRLEGCPTFYHTQLVEVELPSKDICIAHMFVLTRNYNNCELIEPNKGLLTWKRETKIADEYD